MQNLDTPGLSIAIINDGQIIYHKNKGVANKDTLKSIDNNSIFEAASLSKPVFAYLTLRLVDQGVLSLDQPLYKYLPIEALEYDTRYQKITARMVLSHTTGLPNWRWFDPVPHERNVERGQIYLKHEPGTFGYSGEGFNYLAMVIAHLTEHNMTTLDQLFQNEVAKPLGMHKSAFIQTAFIKKHKVMGHKAGQTSDDGWPRSFPDDTPLTFGAAGRLHTNAEDYAHFLLAVMDKKGLPKHLWREMLRPQSQVPKGHKTFVLTGDTAWGLGIAIEPTPYGIRYEHGGNNGDFQSGMMFFIDSKQGYVFMTNSDQGQALNQKLDVYVTNFLRH